MTTPKTFKGFAEPIAIFKTGNHKDSLGNPVTITDDDLGQMVSNYAKDKVPFVVGHPKTDAPAYGWSAGLSVVDGVLFTESENVHPQFEKLVNDGSFRNRSVSIDKNEAGEWYIGHVGFLGAAAPAIDLPAMDFATSEETRVFEFSSADLGQVIRQNNDTLGWAFRMLGSWLRDQREKEIEANGVDAADKLYPEYRINQLERVDADLIDVNDDVQNDLRTYAATLLSQINEDGDTSMAKVTPKTKKPASQDEGAANTFSKEQLDAAVEKGVQAATATAQRETAAAEFTASAIERGIILPADGVDLTAFMLTLDDSKAFNFNKAGDDGTVEKVEGSQLDYFTALFDARPKAFASLYKQQVEDEGDDETDRRQFSGPPGTTVDADRLALHNAALKFQAANSGTSYQAAVIAVSQV